MASILPSSPAAMGMILSAFFVLVMLIKPSSAAGVITLNYQKIPLMSVTGPEGLAFDAGGGGPYAGVSDGRVLKWLGTSRGWTEFSVPSSTRNRRLCDGSTNAALEDTCGRPLGLQFHKATGDLYIADAYYGLLVVGSKGGPARQLATDAEGVPFRMTNGVDVDQDSGVVYFSDSSTRFHRRDWYWCIASGDHTGRLMRYDPRTKQLTVLLRGLYFANGVALSGDGAFVLVAETSRQRITRYWIKGTKAGSSDLFAVLPGNPDNIDRNQRGDFWVALGLAEGSTVAVKLDGEGRTLEVLKEARSMEDALSEVEEHNGNLWLGSVASSFVGVYRA